MPDEVTIKFPRMTPPDPLLSDLLMAGAQGLMQAGCPRDELPGRLAAALCVEVTWSADGQSLEAALRIDQTAFRNLVRLPESAFPIA